MSFTNISDLDSRATMFW